MNNELKKRIFTALVALFLFIFFINQEKILFVFFLTFIFFIIIYEWYKLIRNRLIFMIGIFYLTISFIFSYYLHNENLLFFVFIILISCSSDIGGFIFGKLLKGPKLTKISPNKTYSGMVGSYIASILFGVVYVNYFNTIFNLTTIHTLILIIVLISTINQMGDLLISYFKRKINIKNTGIILPGHGGLLDRLDGIIFTLPAGYLLYLYLITT
jgi:phosphatidate cytidylyltransferase